MLSSIKLSDLNNNNCTVLREATKTRPPIWLIEKDGNRMVIKDFSTRSFIYRNIVGRLLIWREARAYKILQEIKGIPKFYGTIDGLAIILEEVQGQNIQDIEKEIKTMTRRQEDASKIEEKKKILSDKFFNDLRALVDKIHKRGIVHCDLKRTPNIMIGDDSRPYIVDWASYMTKRVFFLFPFNLIYNRFLEDDCLAVTKLKVNNRPDLSSPEELKSYDNYKMQRDNMGFEKIIRGIRQSLRDLLKKVT